MALGSLLLSDTVFTASVFKDVFLHPERTHNVLVSHRKTDVKNPYGPLRGQGATI